MSRSSTFKTPAREPLTQHPQAKLREETVQGPLSWLNPTLAQFDIHPKDASWRSALDSVRHVGHAPDLPADAQVAWRARDNRKGRHVLLIPKDGQSDDLPNYTASAKEVAKGIWRMCTVLAWWDVSWWIGVLFSWGSAIFVMSGFFYWLPLAAPSSTFPHEDTIAGGVTSCIGATMFQLGAILLIVEACNENQVGCFGWALEHAFSHHDTDTEKEPNGVKSTTGTKQCAHTHIHGIHRKSALKLQHPKAGRKWEWWPTWQELTEHYFHEIGFLASLSLAIGSTVFWISGIMALPWIFNSLSQGVAYGVYWLAYLVGGIFFVISSALYMLETQPNWYTPAPKLLGWWIGVFNMIGSVGWTLSASFGYCSPSWCAYQSDLSLTWASITFLIGSLLLWFEALDKYPVEKVKK